MAAVNRLLIDELLLHKSACMHRRRQDDVRQQPLPLKAMQQLAQLGILCILSVC